MSLSETPVGAGYRAYTARKFLIVGGLTLALVPALMAALSLGPAAVPASDVIRALLGLDVPRQPAIIVWNIRLPQALAAIVAGAGLAVAGRRCSRSCAILWDRPSRWRSRRPPPLVPPLR